MSISEHAVLRSMHCYKQVTLSTSETPVKEGLRRTFEMITRRHCFQRLHFVVKLMCAVKAYFVLDAEQSIAAAIFAEGLDAENCLPTEYSGYASSAAAAVAAAAAA